jgi:hypothetical protein
MAIDWRLAIAVAIALSGARPAGPPPVPVVVELFTSEGCSSCPPADQLLARLSGEQPIAGAQVIALGMHVTYWDRLGWKDAASLAAATERQQEYARVFGGDRIYTPQAVVDGRDELVGSDERGLGKAIGRAAAQPHARVTISSSLDGDALVSTVGVADPPAAIQEPLQMRLAVTEDGLVSIVKRGENGGRTLHHDAVVRALSAGALLKGGTMTFRTTLRPEWRRERLHAVAFVQGRNTQRIWGAAATALK